MPYASFYAVSLCTCLHLALPCVTRALRSFAPFAGFVTSLLRFVTFTLDLVLHLVTLVTCILPEIVLRACARSPWDRLPIALQFVQSTS